jgi:hypothetical protein
MTNQTELTLLEIYLTNEFCKIWHVLIAADAELQAYRDGSQRTLSDTPQELATLREFVSGRKRSPALHKTLKAKYAPILHRLINGLPERAPHTDSVVQALVALEDSDIRVD